MVDDAVEVQLRWGERASALYFGQTPRAPLDAVRSVRLVVKPKQFFVETLVEVPLVVNFGIPFRRDTTLPSTRANDGGRACVVTRRSTPAVVVELDPARSPWSLFIISDRDAEQLTATIERASRL